ncbi:DUF6392 family protein [Larsenimonas suaedae]|uniref:DUF6392 family protein n=1 Tax=Larsenimonas suaedae TaxID=1851019 RepID=A0ABU1GY31_9GAMM|nr:DUF6392 family protein [Larsenimonas suaedae]MCM2973355.1 DUF6392 family protein [Larsenimonas suaedae]MDR5896248.1 DUF6392 family protein [Larsenimonas suaedae]
MNTEADKLIEFAKSIGQQHQALVDGGVIEPKQLTKTFPDSEWSTYHAFEGVELTFWDETMALDRVLITVRARLKNGEEFSGSLPLGLNSTTSRSEAIGLFGDPIESQEAQPGPPPIGMIGPKDTFRIAITKRHHLRLILTYQAEKDCLATVLFRP